MFFFKVFCVDGVVICLFPLGMNLCQMCCDDWEVVEEERCTAEEPLSQKK